MQTFTILMPFNDLLGLTIRSSDCRNWNCITMEKTRIPPPCVHTQPQTNKQRTWSSISPCFGWNGKLCALAQTLNKSIVHIDCQDASSNGILATLGTIELLQLETKQNDYSHIELDVMLLLFVKGQTLDKMVSAKIFGNRLTFLSSFFSETVLNFVGNSMHTSYAIVSYIKTCTWCIRGVTSLNSPVNWYLMTKPVRWVW